MITAQLTDVDREQVYVGMPVEMVSARSAKRAPTA